MGYFIDFYDLTIMGVSYNELIQEQFHITGLHHIQQTYLLISNFQTAGIFIGALLFGILGDKIGRASAIRYSILLYSISTLLATFTHSLPLFILLRTLSYIGLATEFSTSTVLILELFPIKSASWGSAILYSFGVLGGIVATSIGFFSWQAMFICGGIAGLILFALRSNIQESEEFLYSKKHFSSEHGSIRIFLTNRTYLLGIIKYLLMILPYYAIITMMFIFPNSIIKNYSIGYATKILLLGFFIVNIVSSLASAWFNNHFKNFKASLIVLLIAFMVLMNLFTQVKESEIFIYSFGLGLIGGGYPISWAQQVAREYPVKIRSLASNILFALGRASSIIFNTFIALWIAHDSFVINAHVTVFIIFILALGSIFVTSNNYTKLETLPK